MRSGCVVTVVFCIDQEYRNTTSTSTLLPIPALRYTEDMQSDGDWFAEWMAASAVDVVHAMRAIRASGRTNGRPIPDQLCARLVELRFEARGTDRRVASAAARDRVMTRKPSLDQHVLIARCRWLLHQEAEHIVSLLEPDEMTERRLRDELLLAVGRALPRSRLVPWDLDDAAVEAIAARVARDVAAKGRATA